MALIFLTGASGFVGRYLAPKLAQAQHKVRCLIRAPESPEQAALLQQELGCEIIWGDLLEPYSWQASLQAVDTVIHLAALHSGPPELIHRTNANGTADLVSAAEAMSAKKFLYLSTLTAAPRPEWPYAHSTWLAEQAIQQSNLDYTILRCSIIVGPGDPFLEGIISMARRWPLVPVMGTGKTKFQPVYVGDAVRCLLKAIQEPNFSRKLLPIGGSEVLSYNQIVDHVLEAFQLRKRKAHLPRRATRWLVRRLERLGLHTPFVPGHFLSRDHTAHSLTVIEENFGFTPTKLQETLKTLLSEAFAP